ncbi:TPA: hypothetical protein KKW55_000986 [Legionella pneumophila]|uniref:hypothetical protein n=1 Tax=Legionella pneumophila TaxID=446 RepID=UPI00137526E9|nr:hypothetical protein [Legionella pneumophila]HAT1793994.1 hypothetical protein [Legionella pneumophila]HAT1872391.1 hypothetical protein [Legionella pneumophila]HAT7921613.1 hypothetical protein [Legionella pneumophila]HAT8309071.1 hypothetical protein [Legionella pneumophila]HAT8739368.1 hypothetical protein [Legionella pneumophila]
MGCLNKILWLLNQNLAQSIIGVITAWFIYSRWKNQHRLIEKSKAVANVTRKIFELNHKIIELRSGPKFRPLFDENYINFIKNNYIPKTNEILEFSFILSKELSILDKLYDNETYYATKYNQLIREQLIDTIKKELISFQQDLAKHEFTKELSVQDLLNSSFIKFINPMAASSAIGKVKDSETGVLYVEDDFQILINKNFDEFVTQLNKSRI